MTLQTSVLCSSVPQLALCNHVCPTIWFLLRCRPVVGNADPSRTYSLILLWQWFVFDAGSPFFHQFGVYGPRRPSFVRGGLHFLRFFFLCVQWSVCPWLLILWSKRVFDAVVVAIYLQVFWCWFRKRAVCLSLEIWIWQVCGSWRVLSRPFRFWRIALLLLFPNNGSLLTSKWCLSSFMF